MILRKRCLTLVIACLSLAILAGCGFKSDPTPANGDDLFSLKSIKVTAESPCIAVSGEVSGNEINVDELLFEVQKAGEEADCPTCPFKSDEQFIFTPGELGLISNGGKFDARFCPTQISSLYRVRVTAKSKFFGLPDSISKEHFVEMP